MASDKNSSDANSPTPEVKPTEAYDAVSPVKNIDNPLDSPLSSALPSKQESPYLTTGNGSSEEPEDPRLESTTRRDSTPKSSPPSAPDKESSSKTPTKPTSKASTTPTEELTPQQKKHQCDRCGKIGFMGYCPYCSNMNGDGVGMF